MLGCNTGKTRKVRVELDIQSEDFHHRQQTTCREIFGNIFDAKKNAAYPRVVEIHEHFRHLLGTRASYMASRASRRSRAV